MNRLCHGKWALPLLMILILAVLGLGTCSPAVSSLSSWVKAPSTAVPSIQLEPCQLGDIAAQCGSIKVYENRATNQGRMIGIKVAVIKAQDANPAPDPIFYLAGEPGGSAIEAAPYAMQVLKSAIQHRDLVLVDQRGTGGSNLLTCPRSLDEASFQVPLDDAMIQDLKDCLSHLDGDPAAYTTTWGMDDLEDVRRYTVPEKVCAAMPRPQPEALYQPLTTSPAPVLLINNQADGQNPPENVVGAKGHDPNSLTVIAPGQGHGYLGIPCRDMFISACIERGTTKGLDTSCLQKEPLPPFQ